MTALSEMELLRLQYAMLLKEIHHIEHKIAIMERTKKDPEANDHLLSIGNDLKDSFRNTTTKEIMQDLRGD